MNETISSTSRIYLAEHLVPRLIFTDGKSYLDFNSIRQLCGGDNIAKTTLFCMIKALPNVDGNTIKYRNRSYFDETFILIQMKDLIFF